MPPTNKLILMALADIANELGECWPNVKTIARMSCVSDRTVRRTMKVFEACNALHVIPRFTSNGRQTSNRYRLALETPPDKLSASPVECHGDHDTDVRHPLPRPRQGRVDTAVSDLEPQLNHYVEPPQQRSNEEADRGSPSGRERARDTSVESLAVAGSTLHLPTVLDGAGRSSVLSLLDRCPAHQRQLVLDEVAGRAERNEVRRPMGLLRTLVEAAIGGTFTPNAAIDHADLRERRRREQQSREETRNREPVTAADPMQRLELKAIRNRIAEIGEERRARGAGRSVRGNDV